jgi:succinoglycan biosynthesis protein ExoA
MRVSVIVPVRNEAAHIRAIVRGLASQEFATDDYEVLVVDGASDDGTADIVRQLLTTIPNLYLLNNPKRLASAARNIGVEYARGEFVVIVDGHCQVRDPNFLTRLVMAFESSGADTLGRPQPLRTDQPTAFQRTAAAARTSWLGHNPDSAIYSNQARFVAPDNVAVAYRREVFDRIGRFDESFDACEDVEFNTRVRQAGMTCFFSPAIAVEYQPRGTLRGLAYQMARYGRGRARLGRKHPATITAPSLVPPLWLLWLCVGSLASILWPPLALVVATTIAAYLLVVLAESIRVWQSQSGVSLLRLPIIFAAIHAGFGWGYLNETASGLQFWPIGLARRLIAGRTVAATVGRATTPLQ